MTVEGAELKMKVARESAAALAGQPGVRGVYLAGSLSAGLGTPTSDVDLCVVADNASDADVVSLHELVESERLDVVYRSPTAIAELPGPFESFTATSTDFGSLALTPRQIDDAVRLLLGEDVVSCPEVTQARDRMQAAALPMRQVLLGRYAVDCKCVTEDLAGALAVGDTDAALYLSAALVMRAAQAYLVGCGELYVGEKWTWQKLRRAGADRAVELLRRALATSPVPDADATRRARQAQSLLAAALLDGWEGSAAASPLVAASSGRRYVRAPLVMPVRVSDGVVMFNYAGGPSTRLSVAGFTLWALCDGRPPVAVVGDAANRTGLDAAELSNYLTSMVEHGLVSDAR